MKSDDFLESLGEAVRARRRELGLSQDAFADKVGLHRTYIGGVERGERNLGAKNLIKISQALHLKVSELISAAESLRPPARGTRR